MLAWVVYCMLGLNGADRLAFATCETHCETFIEIDDNPILYKPRCIIGVWALLAGESGLLIGAILTRYTQR